MRYFVYDPLIRAREKGSQPRSSDNHPREESDGHQVAERGSSAAKTLAVAVETERLEPGRVAIGEHEKRARLRVLTELALDEPGEPLEPCRMSTASVQRMLGTAAAITLACCYESPEVRVDPRFEVVTGEAADTVEP